MHKNSVRNIHCKPQNTVNASVRVSIWWDRNRNSQKRWTLTGLSSSSGNISKTSSLFTYDSAHLLDSYYFPPSHDSAFVPAFTLPERPDDPLVADMSALCVGEGAEFCTYDTLVTRSLEKGNATLGAYRSHQTRASALEPGTASFQWRSLPSEGPEGLGRVSSPQKTHRPSPSGLPWFSHRNSPTDLCSHQHVGSRSVELLWMYFQFGGRHSRRGQVSSYDLKWAEYVGPT